MHCTLQKKFLMQHLRTSLTNQKIIKRFAEKSNIFSLFYKKNDAFFNTMVVFASFFIISWIILLFLSIFHIYKNFDISKIASIVIEFAQIYTLLISLKIYFSSNQKDKKTYLWLIIGMVALILDRVGFYMVIYLHHISIANLPLFAFFTYCIPFIAWLIFITIFFVSILLTSTSSNKIVVRNFMLFLILNIPVATLFFLSFKAQANTVFMVSLITKYIIIHKLILFDLLMLCMLNLNNKGLMIAFSGIAVITGAGTFLNYSELSNTHNLLLYSELFWLFGIILLFVGLLSTTKGFILMTSLHESYVADSLTEIIQSLKKMI